VRFRFGLLQGDGTKLANLRQAIAHLAKFIPKAERDLPQVLTASNIMTKAAEQGGPVELARIATLLAINRVRPLTQGKALGQAQTRARSMKQEAGGVAA
jgi:hypothetical protein